MPASTVAALNGSASTDRPADVLKTVSRALLITQKEIIMAGSRHPGSLGAFGNHPIIDAGTLASVANPLPGPIGVHATEQQAPVAREQPKDAEIEALKLAPVARNAAYALKKVHPGVKFTSGLRDKEGQARAMASNVASNRKWIAQTYKKTALRQKCQDWVDNNPTQTTKEQIMLGLLKVMGAASDMELGELSKHWSGMAFDVQPVERDAEAIKKTISSLPYLDLFLEKEGGMVRWHVQF